MAWKRFRDVTEIVLNVKSIIAKLHSEGVKTVYIEASGECEVTAGDIKADGEVEVLNPELHIATLGPDASLNMELTLSHGRGYVPADRNKPAQTIIGLIPVDSIYTPVRKVNYTVENTRVGDATDYDKLTLAFPSVHVGPILNFGLFLVLASSSVRNTPNVAPLNGVLLTPSIL